MTPSNALLGTLINVSSPAQYLRSLLSVYYRWANKVVSVDGPPRLRVNYFFSIEQESDSIQTSPLFVEFHVKGERIQFKVKSSEHLDEEVFKVALTQVLEKSDAQDTRPERPE